MGHRGCAFHAVENNWTDYHAAIVELSGSVGRRAQAMTPADRGNGDQHSGIRETRGQDWYRGSRPVISYRLQVGDDRVTLDALMLGDGAKDRTERTEPEGMVVGNRDPLVSRLGGFQNDVAADPMHPRVLTISGTRGRRGARRKRREESSCHHQDFVADKVESNSFRPGPVKKERRGRFEDVLAQLVPRVPFGEDAFREALGAVTAIGLLDHLEHQFDHTSMVRHEFPGGGSVVKASRRGISNDKSASHRKR